MKKILLFSFLILTSYSLTSQITHTDYGDGLVIKMDADYSMDIDDDGKVDFYVNKFTNELGFTPIFGKGCFTSPANWAHTSWNARELQLHEFGDVISISDSNMFDYIDDNRGAAFSATGGLAEGWAHLTDQYIGFAVFSNGFEIAMNGWMRVQIDIVENTLIIKEIAFNSLAPIGSNNTITAGQTSLVSSVPNLDKVLTSVSVGPNPSDAFTLINYDYKGNEALDIQVMNTEGKMIFRKSVQNTKTNASLTLNTAEWNAGLYLIQFRTVSGVQTERLIVNH